MKEREYIEQNRAVYDSLAEEYAKRAGRDKQRDRILVNPTLKYMRERFAPPHRLLDFGCGNGINLEMFHEEGVEVTGIDLSSRMLNVARQNCPAANLIHGDFLVTPFSPNYFHCVFSKASLHLFPKTDAERCLIKIREILVPKGLLYVTTTLAANSVEGFRPKQDYTGAPARYRKNWTQEELLEAVVNAGFTLKSVTTNAEPEREKSWLNIWALSTDA